MKAYKDYMDRITVSEEQHAALLAAVKAKEEELKIASQLSEEAAQKTAPEKDGAKEEKIVRFRKILPKAVATACLLLVLLGGLPLLMQNFAQTTAPQNEFSYYGGADDKKDAVEAELPDTIPYTTATRNGKGTKDQNMPPEAGEPDSGTVPWSVVTALPGEEALTSGNSVTIPVIEFDAEDPSSGLMLKSLLSGLSWKEGDPAVYTYGQDPVAFRLGEHEYLLLKGQSLLLESEASQYAELTEKQLTKLLFLLEKAE